MIENSVLECQSGSREGKELTEEEWNGATYVDVENNNIRTAFKKEQFDTQTLKIREVAEKYGIKKD